LVSKESLKKEKKENDARKHCPFGKHAERAKKEV